MVCFLLQMRQNSSGQIRPVVPNGPSVNSSLPAHPAPRSLSVRPPCSAQPLTNGPVPPGPRPPSVCNNHVAGARANGDVPYLHPTALPHNCTSPREPRKSQHLNSTQVNISTTRSLDHTRTVCLCKAFDVSYLQGLQKGPGSHWAGPNGDRTLSSSASAEGGPNNQVGHSATTPSDPSEPAVNHLSSPSSAASPASSSSHTATSGAPPGTPLTKESAAQPGNGSTAANHHSPGRTPASTSGSPATHSTDNPQLSALLGGKESPAAGLSLTAPGGSDVSSPVSALSTASPSPRSAEHAAGLNKLSSAVAALPAHVTVNGSGGVCSEDSRSPVKVELPELAVKAAKPPHSSSTVSIYPTSADVLKACR